MLVYGVTSEVEIKIDIGGLHKKRRFDGSLLKIIDLSFIYIIYLYLNKMTTLSK